ncbi:MAG TPA: hypothetical protein VMO81_08590, partial [Aestuariivirgaceae bacterium]|nr:hypothetical protein [Aestuariivirgaceae bacterium]
GFARPVLHPKSTTLARELTKVFRQEKLLGRGEDAIKRHKVVRNFPISSDGSLRADFAAKNNKMHITETVDLRTHNELTAARLKDVAVAAVTLAEARRKFGSRRTERYFVYAATAADENHAKGYLEAAGHNAEHIFNFATRQDRASYFDFIIGALRVDLAARARQRP